MTRQGDVIAVIPARCGSKSIAHKNIRDFCGKPLIAHSIEQALAVSAIGRVIVSTDSEQYAVIARRYGAEVPFLRPPEYATDASTDLDVFRHLLGWLGSNEGRVPDMCVHLRPTHPNRTPGDIEGALAALRGVPDWDSVRSVVPAPETPFKMWFLGQDRALRPVIATRIPDAHSQPRQNLPATYLQNACVDVIRSRTILEQNSIAGQRIGAYLMRDFHDIDTVQQFAEAESAFAWREGVPQGKRFCFDIDGVIASIVPGNDYRLAEPLTENIRRINRIFDRGNHIVLCTARGSMTGLDWTAVTAAQLLQWGVRHHELRFGKPAADYYIDDRMLSLATLAEIDHIP